MFHRERCAVSEMRRIEIVDGWWEVIDLVEVISAVIRLITIFDWTGPVSSRYSPDIEGERVPTMKSVWI